MNSDGSRYQLLKLIHQHGPVSVYKGQHQETKEVLCVHIVDAASPGESVKDLQKRATRLCHCDSPYLPRWHKSFVNESDGYLWIIVDYLHGLQLSQQLKSGVIPEAYVAIILREVLRGLKYLHSQHLAHGNIKAANIILTHGRLKLNNVAATSHWHESKGSKIQSSSNSPHWVAPEVVSGASYTERSDVWAVGILAIELATGEPPRAHEPHKQMLQSILKEDPPRLHGEFSRPFKDFVSACLAKDP
eukprot:TRINITY_DN4382_c0_g1_i1.p2 TRINITY_DN4382_c0_g1~~TRINITY_DN4382_c0_g1_i1.p2  ORF type:complete len:246 (-),score=31.77 TRINITY_DN4382_c0_g1_i1:896-1633(-)